MSKVRILFLMSLFVGPTAPATNTVLYGGGGGEPKGPTTMFDESMTFHGNLFLLGRWNSTVLYDHGHSESEKQAAAAFGQKIQPFTRQNFEAEMKILIEKAKAGQFKQGDQVMVMMNTHGAPVTKDPHTFVHSVASANNGELLDFTPRVRELQHELEQRGVRFAVVDFSCYSGTTMNLATDKTCVIAGAGRESIGYQEFIDTFAEKMQVGRSLEEIFLLARTQSSLGVPAISTEAGRTLQSLEEFFDRGVEDADIFKPIPSSPTVNCSESRQKLTAFISELKNKLNAFDSSQIETAYDEYQKKFANLLSENEKLAVLGARQVPSPGGVRGPRNTVLQHQWSALVDEAERKFAELEKQEQTVSKGASHGSAQLLSALKDQKLAYEQLSADPEFKAFEKERLHFKKQRVAVWNQFHRKVMRAERKAYEEAYSQMSKTDQGPNPCRDFIL